MTGICNTLSTWNPCKTDVEKDHSVNVRNARIQGIAMAVLATLAAIATVAGILGFTGHMGAVGTGVAQNALWVTLAGGIALALMLIGSAGCYCANRQAQSTEGKEPARVPAPLHPTPEFRGNEAYDA